MTTVTQLPSGMDRVIMEAHYPNLTPEQVFDAFTTADGLLRWWSPIAETDARLGGAYHLRWTKQNIDLRGNYVEFERGKRLAFTWNWDHEPHIPTRMVEIDFEPEGTGTHITLTHGSYTGGDTEEWQGHIDGWLYYLERLGKLGE